MGSIAVNARFRDRPASGVERVAGELIARLPMLTGEPLLELAPRRPAQGFRGHAWEQLALPVAFRRSGAGVLLSLCNFGPVAVRRQIVLIHDVAPFVIPESFTCSYVRQARLVQRALARRAVVATTSEFSRRDLARSLGLSAERISIISPAVGEPFRVAIPGPGGRYCVFVGGHDPRKNVQFLLGLWRDVYDSTDLVLHVVARSQAGAFRPQERQATPGVQWHYDLDDGELAGLLAGAMCVVSPSRYEGFGLPLLEGMACGTPFLATDTGSAAELAVSPEQLLPLDPRGWVARLIEWSEGDLRGLRQACLDEAVTHTWEASAQRLVDLAGDVAARR